ncbi:MAG TPA: ATP-dependent DNA helicase RecG, partial [Planctomycetota bacterium]|nr:ATP-dependent DNA helicase RecG [Planctomycetota bacterium]
MKQGEAGTNPGFFPASGAGLESVLKYLRGVGPRRAEGLARLGLVTVDDLLHHVPHRYEDRRGLCRIEEAVVGKTQVLHGEIASVRERSLGGRRTLVEARMVDAAGAAGGQGAMDLVWFNQPYIIEWLQPGCRLHVYGQVKLHRGRLQMPAPEFELDAEPEQSEGGASPHIQRIVPVYPLTKGVHQRFLRGLVFRILEEDLANLGIGRPGSPYDQFHPDAPPLLEAYRLLHFPEDWKDIDSARARFVFDERFVFASQLIFRRQICREGGGASFAVTADLDRKIRSVFPFRLTADQDRAIAEITRDLESPSPMYRLLQGDVGTGKTAVALYAMLAAVRNGHQAALMAPTEVLAVQHHRTISKALERHPVRTSLLTGSLRPPERRAASEAIASGKSHIVIGTHALCQESVTFRKLGLVVIDEQHRFGVRERMRLRKKGKHPHVLVMTATPIPRSLCLTCYGDLDFSLLRERPRGRPPVKTHLVSGKKRAAAMEFIRKELGAGRQAYFVYPLIEESEALTLPAATKAHEILSREVFPEFRVALLHGQMPPAEKDREL